MWGRGEGLYKLLPVWPVLGRIMIPKEKVIDVGGIDWAM